MPPFQRRIGAGAWKGRAFSRRYTACKCDQQCFHVSGSYQISYSCREIGRRPPSLVPTATCVKIILTATACVRSLRSGDWHFYDSAHPGQRQRRPCDSSAHHAHHHMQVNVSLSPASISTHVRSAIPSLTPENCKCINMSSAGIICRLDFMIAVNLLKMRF